MKNKKLVSVVFKKKSKFNPKETDAAIEIYLSNLEMENIRQKSSDKNLSYSNLPKKERQKKLYTLLYSLSNSCRHSANATAIADVKSKITVSRRHCFADMIYSAT